MGAKLVESIGTLDKGIKIEEENAKKQKKDKTKILGRLYYMKGSA